MSLYSETMLLYNESVIYKVSLHMSLFSETVFPNNESINLQSESANVSVQ